jgi:MFS family permease
MSFGTAAAKDIQTVLITRFFTGFFGSAPITCTGGVFVDLWHPTQRGNAIVGYTFCVCGGPVGSRPYNRTIIRVPCLYR